MARSDRLVWIKSVLKAVPIYSMMADCLPPWAVKEIDAICRRFLWAGGDAPVQGKCMVSWGAACKPMIFGGLGIADLRLTGYALQARWLWLQRTDNARAWSCLPLRVEPNVQAFFRASTYFQLGNGRTTLFWTDKWLDQAAPADLAPNLARLVSRRTQSTLTVEQGLLYWRWTHGITGSLSPEAIAEYAQLRDALTQVSTTDSDNKLIWHWSSDGNYSAKSAYNMLHSGSVKLSEHSLIWKAWAPLKVKIFLWLAFRKKHWTADHRARHGLEARQECFLCDQALETIDHLLCACPFAREAWFLICQVVDVQLPPSTPSVCGWWKRLRHACLPSRRKGMDSLFALTSWELWKERNDRLFRGETKPMAEFLQVIKVQAELWVAAGAKELGSIASGA